ncbi:universal stress protein [Halorientalis pallida]|uniref:universal stress protein n=1 Tax=Halorientalis pallida TaxID=2479928 RepID=UPI003C7029D0
MYDAILVPTDGSEGTTRTLEHAVELARNHDAAIHALAVVDERKYQALPEERRDEASETMQKRAERAVGEVRTRAEEVDVPVTTAIREGIPSERIVEYATQSGVDVIAIGTHGRSDHERYARLGSVTQRVVENANVPVFVVHVDD